MPDFNYLWAEPFPIPIHAIMAMAALLLGVIQLVSPKGTFAHKTVGYIFTVLMFGTAISALIIHEIRLWGPYSPIHLLIPVTIISLWLGIRAARRGDIQKHRKIMLALFFLALVVTGFFTLLPNRVMYAVFFGSG